MMHAVMRCMFCWVWVLLLAPPSHAALHPVSPCPSIFSYEGSQPEHERWHGIVQLHTDEPLVGVRLDVKLDRAAEILVSWMGKVSTEDNIRFTILSLDQKLHPGPAIPSRFMVKFNALKGSPQVRTIRLNGRQICPPDPNFGSDLQNNQDHIYEDRYTTERVTRRPDLDFDDDWTNTRPVTSSRPTNGGSRRPDYNSHETDSSYGGGGGGGNSYSHNIRTERTTTTEDYNSHESYGSHSNSHRPAQTYGNRTRVTQSTQTKPSHSVHDNDSDTARPSINININKDVTYNVRPDTLNYNSQETTGGRRPTENREPSYSNTRPTDNYNNGGVRDEFYGKTTTKKPVVINISIQGGDNDETTKPTTRKPSSNSNKNTNQRTTTSRPSSGSRPHRNPEISSNTHHQTGNDQSSYNSREKTTEKYYQSGNEGSNYGQGSHNSYPSPVPSIRPGGNDGMRDIPRPQTTNRPKHGDEGELEVANQNVKCGRVEVNVNATPLITHGQTTSRGQWPWHIALYRIEGINLSYSCGGSLITSTVVITAAHCVTKAPRDRPVDPEILVVQLGKYHLYQFSDDSVQNKQVRDIYVHPSYNSTTYLDDIAILVLSSPAEFTKYVRPVCLWPKHNFNLQSIDNKEGTVVGWGYDENNQVTEELKMARMPVVSYVTCITSYPQFFSQFTAPNKTFCAGFRQGTSVCNGDSGGGMVFQQDGVWYLRGLVSITVAKQGLRVCDTNHYVVFTDIANYVDWILRHLSPGRGRE